MQTVQHTGHQVGRTAYNITIPKTPARLIGRGCHPFAIHFLFYGMILIKKIGCHQVSATICQLIFGKLLALNESSFFQNCYLVPCFTQSIRHRATACPRADNDHIIDFHTSKYLVLGLGNPP